MPGLRAYRDIDGLRVRAALPARDRGLHAARRRRFAGDRRRTRRGLHSRDPARRDRAPRPRLRSNSRRANAPILEVVRTCASASPRAALFRRTHFIGRQQCRLRAASERVRRHRRRKRQRQEHAGAADRRARDADRRAASPSPGSDGRQRRGRRASPPPRPDGVPGPAIGAQSAPPRRQHRDAAAGGGRARPGRRGSARAGLLLARDRAAARSRRRAFRRSFPAGSASASTSRARSAPCRAS